MSRIVIFSNRLPVTVKKNRDGGFEYAESIGGLSTGLKSYHKQAGSLWVGWPGIADDELDIAEKQTIQKTLLEEYQCLPVFLSNRDIDLYYYGFCNKTIWPLFHYFSSKTEYDFDAWAAYNRINRRFFETARPFLGQSDAIWVHDYQLMLLPGMIKEEYSDTPVGFFLHIPFPSFELFRLLIWREEILAGLLGADLIGFHTYDYVRHFLSCTRRLLGLEDNLNRIAYEDRYVWVDAFPMGIDYEWFAGVRTDGPSPEFSIDHVNDEGNRIVLSVDRLDYTKGIPQRIRAFRRFLARYPEYRQKVKLYLIVAPSREGNRHL